MFNLEVYLDCNLQPNLNVQELGCPQGPIIPPKTLYILYYKSKSPRVEMIYYLNIFY